MENLSINSQWHCFLRHCAQHAKQSVVAELDCGVVVCWTQSVWMFMNEFFLSTPVVDELDLRRRLEAIKTYVRKVQPAFPWMLLIEPEWLPSGLRERTREICLAADFTHAFDANCMQTTSLLPPLRPLPEVEVKFATSKQDVLDAALLNVRAYDTDASVAQNLVDNHGFIGDFEKQLCCLVLVNSQPVATATTLLLDKCLYVAFVATSKQHRKVCSMLTWWVFQICWVFSSFTERLCRGRFARLHWARVGAAATHKTRRYTTWYKTGPACLPTLRIQRYLSRWVLPSQVLHISIGWTASFNIFETALFSFSLFLHEKYEE